LFAVNSPPFTAGEKRSRKGINVPKFTTISPTCEQNGKERCWDLFRTGNYIAVGWLYKTPLHGMAIEEILERLDKDKGSYEPGDLRDARVSLPAFWSLNRGDLVGVNKVNYGLFGIGVIDSDYDYDKRKHLAEAPKHYYPHFYSVKWLVSEYIRARDMNIKPEKAWKPRGTVGRVDPELPEYIKRLLKANGHSSYISDE